MIFRETRLPGAYVVELDRKEDPRGFFARGFCEKEFAERGLHTRMVQANFSYSARRGTIRGMHYQVPPASEPKLVRCIRGAVWDVIVDMRPGSPTYLRHFAIELSAQNRKALYIPDMFAHGNQALTDDVELFYQVGEFYTPGCERGARFDDPALGIEWPLPPTCISEKDAAWQMLDIKPAEEAPKIAAA